MLYLFPPIDVLSSIGWLDVRISSIGRSQPS